jgi:hypothetical protein
MKHASVRLLITCGFFVLLAGSAALYDPWPGLTLRKANARAEAIEHPGDQWTDARRRLEHAGFEVEEILPGIQSVFVRPSRILELWDDLDMRYGRHFIHIERYWRNSVADYSVNTSGTVEDIGMNYAVRR